MLHLKARDVRIIQLSRLQVNMHNYHALVTGLAEPVGSVGS